MPCIPFQHNGVTGIVCTSRRSGPRCSTPGCRRKGRLECDHPVEREHADKPKRGDARLHREHRVVFYVWSVTGENVSVSTSPIGGRASLQTVTVADWWAKTSATCDRPVCEQCAVRVGELDYCAAHGSPKALAGGAR